MVYDQTLTRLFVSVLIAFSAWFRFCSQAGSAENGVALVEDGEPAATVVLPEKTELDHYLNPTDEEVGAYLEKRFPKAGEEVKEAARKKLPEYRSKQAKRVGDEEELAMEELVAYVEKISGAKLSTARVAEDADLPDGPKVLLGGKLARQAGFGEALDALDPDGFIIRRHDGDLVVSGRRARGTLYGVYEVLEMLGCRWVLPGPAGEIIPSTDDVVVAQEKTENPSHSQRYWWCTYGHGEEYPRWTLRNKGNYVPALDDGKVAQSHALSRPLRWGAKTDRGITVRKGDRDVRQLPDEYYALYHGKPRRSTPNMSNPTVWQLYADYYENYFSEHPFHDYVSISAEDGLVLDDREATRELDSGDYDWTLGKPSATDRLWFFHNRFIEKVRTTFPNRKYGVLVYSNNMMPPRIQRVHPNMALVFAPLSICPLHHVRDPKCKTNRPYRRWFKAWMNQARAAGAETYYYDYDPLGYQWNDFMICPQWYIIAKNYPWFSEQGLDGHTTQGHDNWGSACFSHWLMIRLYWDARKDPDEILADYCRMRFGTAAPAVLEFMGVLEKRMSEIPDMCSNEVWDNHLVLTPEVRADCRAALSRAKKLVEDEEAGEQIQMLLAVQKTTDIFCDAIEYARRTADFRGAAERMEECFAIRERMNSEVYSHFFHPRRTNPKTKNPYQAGGWYNKYLTWADHIEQSAAHVKLPRTVKLELDTDYRSLAGGRHLPGTDVSEMQEGDTTVVPDVKYQTQREPAAFFYRTEIEVPDSFADAKRVELYFPSLIARKVQIWVNGEPVVFDHEDYQGTVWNGPEYFWYNYDHQKSFDLGSLVEPGEKNVIAFRIFKSYDHAGSYDRIFLLADPPEAQ